MNALGKKKAWIKAWVDLIRLIFPLTVNILQLFIFCGLWDSHMLPSETSSDVLSASALLFLVSVDVFLNLLMCFCFCCCIFWYAVSSRVRLICFALRGHNVNTKPVVVCYVVQRCKHSGVLWASVLSWCVRRWETKRVRWQSCITPLLIARSK